MRKNSQVRRLISLLLVLTMMLTLCACGGRGRGGNSEEAKAAEEVKPVVNVSGEEADAYMHNDDVIVEHAQHNAAVDTAPVAEREVTEFHMYIPNTETMTGFVNATKVTAYQEGVQCAIDTADNLYTRMYGHSMSYASGASELTWGETKLDERFTRDVQAPRFYQGNALPISGALPTLFDGSDTPFTENGLTVIVSNFVEPGFDVSCIAAGIEDYFDSYPKSGACVIGFTSTFNGEFHIPQYNRTEGRSTFYILNFSSEVPYYMVVVGPLAEVNRYSEQLFKRLDNQDVEYDYDSFSNNVYEEEFAEPLIFDVIPDIGERKAQSPVLASYNTGTLTERETGNAYFATSASATAKDAVTVSSGISVTKSSQISLISTNYDGSSLYECDYTLFVLDQETGGWKEAGKNAESMVTFNFQPETGALEGESGTILTSGREEIYASALLDFGTGSALSRDEIYRLEARIHLNQNRSDSGADHSMSKLARQSINSTDYFDIIDDLCVVSFGNYVWTGTYAEVRKEAAVLFRHTPNLDSLLISLSEVEGKYETFTDKYTYLDFVFNIKDKNSKR